MYRLVGLGFLVLASAPAVAEDPAAIPPEGIGQIFCIGSLGNDMAPVDGLLIAELATLVADAWARNDAIAAARPAEKPPLGDGLPWRTWPDHADGCSVGAVAIDGGKATVAIDYRFSTAPGANYSNTLHLKSVEVDGLPAWRIDDIDLGEGQTFRGLLAGAFAS